MSVVRRDGTRPVAVVTGASAGVGRAAAVELARRGYDVGLLARGQGGLDGAATDVREYGGRALSVPTDVAVAEQVEAAADRVGEELGPIDAWVNNAMTTVFGKVTELTAEEFERATRVTYLGQVHGALAALRHMRARDEGTIVFVGSALSYRGIPLQSAYCAAKFATRGFYESLRAELIHDGSGVRITTVHLPAVNTPQFGWCRAKVDRHPMPVPPIYQPEVAADAIADAAVEAPRQKILGTWNWLIVQLAQAVPGVGDHFMGATAVNGQLTDRRIDPDRPDDLFEPRDHERDHGSHGIFDEQSAGVLTPSFVRSLPGQVRSFLRAVCDRTAELRSEQLDVAPGELTGEDEQVLESPRTARR